MVHSLRLVVGLLSAATAVFALSASDISPDTPTAQLLQSANAQLGARNAHDALVYLDVAIAREPGNYLSLFKRGAAYLSLGKNTQAQHDFDRVLEIKPGFEGALLQRAKIKSRKGDWTAARQDYQAAGKSGSEELLQLNEAEHAAALAHAAADASDWDACVTQAGVAIVVAKTAHGIRKLRAHCRLERGDIAEGVTDLQHLMQMAPGDLGPHLQSAATTFYALGEMDQGLVHLRKCLHSDPDSKTCMTLMKREKAVAKQVHQVKQFFEKRQFAAATKILTPQGKGPGLLQEIKDDVQQYVLQGYVPKNAPNQLYADLLELTCDAFLGMNNKKRGASYCAETLKLIPNSLPGLLSQTQTQLDEGDFDAAKRTLDEAEKHHGQHTKIQELRQRASAAFKRSTGKDYYKVLGVGRDADEREIKKAYRRLSKQYHPDKAASQGISPEAAQSKMAAINEAYEVLSDAELKARFDRGDDPNDPQRQQGDPFTGSPFPGGAQRVVFRSNGPGFPFGQGGPGGQGGQGFPFGFG